MKNKDACMVCIVCIVCTKNKINRCKEKIIKV